MTELRSLASLDELAACVELQRTTWGEGFSDVVPASILQVSQKVGGFVAGAFEDNELVGFVYSLLARFEGTLAHWSHMLAVHPSARGKGLGRRLKLLQRQALLDDGIDTMFWTFDPLVARNAHLNLNRLGASVLRYVPNMYGADTGSPLHGAGETDRFIVRWDLESQRARRAMGGESVQPLVWPPEEHCLVPLPAAGRTGVGELPDGDEVFVEIPPDFGSRRADANDLARWRSTIRDACMTYLRRGYAVQSLRRDIDANRCYYLLRRT